MPGSTTHFREWYRTSDRLADWLWDNTRPHLPRPKRQQPSDGRVVILGDTAIPEDYKRILALGPKFCFEPAFTPPEKVALVKSMARRVAEEERPRFITECVDVLSRTTTSDRKEQHVRKLVNFGIRNNLRFLTSDKEGCFVVIPEGLFQEKALTAIKKNFVRVDVKASSRWTPVSSPSAHREGHYGSKPIRAHRTTASPNQDYGIIASPRRSCTMPDDAEPQGRTEGGSTTPPTPATTTTNLAQPQRRRQRPIVATSSRQADNGSPTPIPIKIKGHCRRSQGIQIKIPIGT
ncbi:hypothetical protein HPB49_002884 [Dermacentor silvarum]|uniref:Uncharacterized protein n=1 Tax=Dermacentor silvarum TaxID=543639 RepID=A0ACB8DAE5_DERSI|nr:hypothetical protein HPB49_002884 [Dermacentor silvarum]